MLMVNVDPFGTLERALHIGLSVGVVVVVWYVLGRRSRLRKRGFRGSCSHMGIALQQLQAIANPQIEYAVEEQLREKEDEDDEGCPDDSVRYYRRLREQIDREHSRNGLRDEKVSDPENKTAH